MATVDVSIAARRDWPLANPWLWMGLGLASCGTACVANLVVNGEPGYSRLVLLLVGLLAAGAAVTVRLNSARNPDLAAAGTGLRQLSLVLLPLLHVALALFFTVMIGAGLFEASWSLMHFGPAVMAWLTVAPASLIAANDLVKRDRRKIPVTANEEASVLLALAGVCCLLTVGTFYSHEDPLAWDSFRMAFWLIAVIAFVGSALVVVSARVRRLALSLLVLLHFGAIATATLSAPPTPSLIGQIWNRLYRPYLECLYLNNAYHFYAPEPGAPSYLWFRLVYEDENKTEQGRWFKVPQMDEKDRPAHPVALEYQRYLALTENATPTDQVPLFIIQSNGMQQPASFFEKRFNHAPKPPGEPLIIGQLRPSFTVPFHPFLTPQQQYSPPNNNARRLIQSYARHVMRMEHPEHPEWKLPTKVKIYRVRHELPQVDSYARAMKTMAANDLESYRPFYMGTYDGDGRLLDQTDPFLYWLLPILRTNSADIDSPIRDYARKHAGDPNWFRTGGANGVWINKDE